MLQCEGVGCSDGCHAAHSETSVTYGAAKQGAEQSGVCVRPSTVFSMHVRETVRSALGQLRCAAPPPSASRAIRAALRPSSQAVHDTRRGGKPQGMSCTGRLSVHNFSHIN
eukprot:scaffold1183_cov418-Prasinococcus_capsulatus_cf.AAC.16